MVDTEASTQMISAESTLQIPGYRLEKLIGSGAMANVFLAIQLSLERKVALKLMSTSLVADATFCERFLKEGKIIGQLSHPNIITIYDIGAHENRYYMAMEYLAGDTLKERIQQGLSLTQSAEILTQVANALGYAHKHHFVHRDVKPANILFRDDSKAVLSDFGIAKTLIGGTQLTAVGWTVGTPHYMSPEQALGKPLDARSDLYSLGIVFYEMLTGELPYHSSDSFSLALMHVSNPVPRLPEQLAEYQEIIDGMLAKNPDDRFASAEKLIEAINKIRFKAKVPSSPTQEETVQLKTSPNSASAAISRRQYRIRWPLRITLILPVIGAMLYGLSQMMTDFPFSTNNSVSVTTIPTPSQDTPQAAKPPSSSEPSTNASAEEASADKKKVPKEVAMLLKVAEGHREMGYLAEPPGMNAAETYERVLALDPNNTQAKRGLQNIAEHYLRRARESINNQENPSTTLKYVNIGLALAPDNEKLRTLHKQLIQEQVTQLLEVAQAHRDMGYLVEPPGLNAAETYHRILQLDPDNAQAKAGLQAIADKYAKLAKESLQTEKDPSVSRKLIETGLTVAPNDPELLSLRKQLNK